MPLKGSKSNGQFSSLVVTISIICSYSFILLTRAKLMESTEVKSSEHPPSLKPFPIDTKFWIQRNEFGLSENWLEGKKPCSLSERIRISDNLVVSLESSFDSLGGAISSNVRDLTLANNGILLLEESDQDSLIDSLLEKYLKGEDSCHKSHDNEMIFEFKPESDRTSWFNPDNWISESNDVSILPWIPDAYRIPCNGDKVVFGTKLGHVNSSKIVSSFAINFRPSSALEPKNLIGPMNIELNEFSIGDEHYNQDEFELLVSSKGFGNFLFNFNDNSSLLGEKPIASMFYINPIPQPSNEDMDSFDVDPLDIHEAGRRCRNEASDRMQAICSFHEPIMPSEEPCHDPIYSSGYCNPICATVITITMEPTMFKEAFIGHTINTKLEQDERLVEETFVAARRIGLRRYEITIRLNPLKDGQIFEEILGLDRQFAQSIIDHITKDSLKTFYGIEEVSMKSSSKYLVNNRSSIFFSYSIIIALLGIATIVVENYYQFKSEEVLYLLLIKTIPFLEGKWIERFPKTENPSEELSSFLRYEDSSSTYQLDLASDAVPVMISPEMDNVLLNES